MHLTPRGLVWSVYLVLALALLALEPGPAYPAIVGGVGLVLAIVTVPDGWRWSPRAADLAIVATLYLACVALFYLAFQVVTVETEMLLFVIYGAGLLLGVVGPLVHVAVIQRRPLADLGLTRQRLPETIALGLVLAALQAAITLPLIHFGPLDSWLPLLVLALMVGIFEAIFFRAYLLAVLAPALGVVPAVAIAAALYAVYHVGYGMGTDEMLFLGGLGIVYTVAYALVRNVLVLWPLLTPVGSFFANVRAGDIQMPMVAIFGFVDVMALMIVAVWLVRRWRHRHPRPGAQPVPVH